MTAGRTLPDTFQGGDSVLTLDEHTGHVSLFYSPDGHTSYGPSMLSVVDYITGRVVKATIQLSAHSVTNSALASAIMNPLSGHVLVSTADNWDDGPVHLDVLDLQSGKILRVLPIFGAPGFYGLPLVVVNTPTHHVFLANPATKTITMFDGTKL